MARKDSDAYLGDADTLLIIMQQHNVKEEQMLYQMADQALAGELDEVVGRMRAWPDAMAERIVDARWLEPPEPFELTLAALEVLEPGEHLRLLIHREPLLLFPHPGGMGLRLPDAHLRRRHLRNPDLAQGAGRTRQRAGPS